MGESKAARPPPVEVTLKPAQTFYPRAVHREEAHGEEVMEEEDTDSIIIKQREAMHSLLQRFVRASSPVRGYVAYEKFPKPSREDESRELELRTNLHVLYRGFAR